MSERGIDDALSEVIGFILIIAIIVIIMSLYLTYVVPTQGRENEIEHMQEVERFFTDQKMNMDSLWYNNQIGVPFNQNLQLGTGGPKTAGSFSVFGIMQPIAATGTAEVIDSPSVRLTINGIWKGGSLTSTGVLGTIQVNEPHTPLFITYDAHDLNDPYQLLLQSTKGDWSALLQVQKNEYITAQNISFDMDDTTKVVSNLRIQENPDLSVTLTITKNDIITLDNLVINSSENRFGSTSFSVNLLDEAYGLNADIEFPFTVTYQYYDSSGIGLIRPPPFISEGYTDAGFVSVNIPLGGFVFESSNNYWLNQNYAYQLGGVFLEQNNNFLPKIHPWIRFKESFGDSGSGPIRIVDVSLNLMSIIQGMSRISGPDSVQVSSKILEIDNSILVNPASPERRELSKFRPNARYLEIEFIDMDNNQALSWRQSFEKMFNDAFIPPGYYDITYSGSSGSYNGIVIRFWGPQGSSTVPDAGDPDLFIDYSQIKTEMSVISTLNI